MHTRTKTPVINSGKSWIERNYHYIWYLIFAFITIILISGLVAKYILKIDDTKSKTSNIHKTEGFLDEDELIKLVTTTTTTATTKPILIKTATANTINSTQRGNIIYYGDYTDNKTFTVSTVDSGQEYGTKDMTHIISIPLGSNSEPFIIKQIYISKFGADNPNGNKIRVSAVDTKKNQVNFASLNYHLSSGQTSSASDVNISDNNEIFYNRITQLANPSTGFYLDNVKTMFGTDLIANKLNIFTNAAISMDATTKIIITGYTETHKWNMDLASRLTKSATPFTAGKLILIRAMTLTAEKNVKEGTKFRITFTNPYSNNVFTYPGAINGEFIYTSNVPRILLPKMLITNKPPSITTAGISISEYEYVGEVSQGDITQFRLEYNLTDLRGSINPDYICPNIQGLINKHLDTETIVDSIEYLDKINTEKVKLSSNKNNLLTLLEQQEDIKKLELMINKIQELQTKRTQETDALTALQFTKQLDEIMRLREALEQRIARRDRNTLDINVVVSDVDAAAAQGTPDMRDIFKIN